jgi:hypothetical protein
MRLPGTVGGAWAQMVRSEKRRVKRAMKVKAGVLKNIVLGAGRDLQMWLEKKCNIVKVTQRSKKDQTFYVCCLSHSFLSLFFSSDNPLMMFISFPSLWAYLRKCQPR